MVRRLIFGQTNGAPDDSDRAGPSARPKRAGWKNRREERQIVEEERRRFSLLRDETPLARPYELQSAHHPELSRAYGAARKRHHQLVRSGNVPNQPVIS